jgi:hypothetical protein
MFASRIRQSGSIVPDTIDGSVSQKTQSIFNIPRTGMTQLFNILQCLRKRKKNSARWIALKGEVISACQFENGAAVVLRSRGLMQVARTRELPVAPPLLSTFEKCPISVH